VTATTARGHEFRIPLFDDGKFGYVTIAAPDDLLIELVAWRALERWRIPPRSRLAP
jgi:hypothetical protein